MALIQELSSSLIRKCLDEAIRRQTPLAMTWRREGQWQNLRTRILQRSEGALWLELPSDPSPDGQEPPPHQELGLSFKFKHHKHIFNATIEAIGQFQLDDGQAVRAVRATTPARMHRVQRRAYLRADVPRNRSVLATFRQGWAPTDHPGPDDTSAAWEGWLTNLSAGGFQVRLTHGAPQLELGDVVNVVIELGQEYQPITAYAQFRQYFTDERDVAYQGFQFVGLNETPRGRKTLQRIGEVVTAFQRLQGRRRANSVA